MNEDEKRTDKNTVCGYNITPWEEQQKTYEKRGLGSVLYKKNNVKKKGKIVNQNGIVGIKDVGNNGQNDQNDSSRLFTSTSIWMEDGKWVDETETLNVCDNCEINEVAYYCNDCGERFCEGCVKKIHRGGKRREHDYYDVAK